MPVRGRKNTYNEEAIREAEEDYGYFALMSNGIKVWVEALKIYRMRNLIGKSFGSLKDRSSMRRMSASSEENFERKYFAIGINAACYNEVNKGGRTFQVAAG